MTTQPLPGFSPFGWRLAAESLRRPYRVTLPMVILVMMVPLYLFIPDMAVDREPARPSFALDQSIPLQPSWVFVYGSLYLFLILLPAFVVRDDELIRRTLFAYLSVWTTAYLCFLVYPTVAPRPESVGGDSLAAWGLRTLYASDPPYNCFPSLHVAHSFVSAFAVRRVHRRLGSLAVVCATLVGISTLFTKQHYVADVVTGAALAWVAYTLFARGARHREVPDLDRRAAPVLALIVAIIVSAFAAFLAVVHLTGFEL